MILQVFPTLMILGFYVQEERGLNVKQTGSQYWRTEVLYITLVFEYYIVYMYLYLPATGGCLCTTFDEALLKAFECIAQIWYVTAHHWLPLLMPTLAHHWALLR